MKGVEHFQEGARLNAILSESFKKHLLQPPNQPRNSAKHDRTKFQALSIPQLVSKTTLSCHFVLTLKDSGENDVILHAKMCQAISQNLYKKYSKVW